jgi:branched-chain amino acid transport system permease protein
LPPELAILLGTGAAAVGLGVIAGGIAIRRQGIYFAMITLALAQMMYSSRCGVNSPAAKTASRRCRAAACSACSTSANEMTMYVFVLVVVLAAFLLIYRIINSPFGEVLKAIRENEQRAISLGYKTDRYKLVAFVLSATLAGLAGSLKALVFQLASLTDVHWTCRARSC